MFVAFDEICVFIKSIDKLLSDIYVFSYVLHVSPNLFHVMYRHWPSMVYIADYTIISVF